MKRILICTTILTTIKTFLIPHIRVLQEMGYSVDVAGNKDVSELDELVDKVFDIPYQRSPFSTLNLTASRKLREIVSNNKYDIIHFHTPVASAFGRWTIKEFRKTGTKIFYTAHGFHFFKGAPLKNWLVYYPVERFLSHYTDVLITLNKEDYNRANTFKAQKVVYVPGVGLDIEKYGSVSVDRNAKRAELGIPTDAVVILSVGELNENKNHEIGIRAVKMLKNPNIYYIICGEGNLRSYLVSLGESLGIADKVKLLGFRTDVREIYSIADIFIFPSFREGLSVSLMEAMAIGLPVVCSNIRGNIDLIENDKGGYLVDPDSVDGFVKGIGRILTEDNKSMSLINKETVRQFDLTNANKEILKLYS